MCPSEKIQTNREWTREGVAPTPVRQKAGEKKEGEEDGKDEAGEQEEGVEEKKEGEGGADASKVSQLFRCWPPLHI